MYLKQKWNLDLHLFRLDCQFFTDWGKYLGPIMPMTVMKNLEIFFLMEEREREREAGKDETK